MKSYSSSAGLCYQTFYNWARHDVRESSALVPTGEGFLPLGLQGSSVVEKPRVELELGDGLILRVY